MVLPALVVVLAVCGGAVGAGVAKVRCLDAARAAARELARGEAPESARRVAAILAPGSRVSFSRDGDLVRVVVTDRVSLGLPGVLVVEELDVRGEAVAMSEAG